MNTTDTSTYTSEAVDELSEAERLLRALVLDASGRCMEPDAWRDAEPIVHQLGVLHQILEYVQTAKLSSRFAVGDFVEVDA